MTEPPLLLQVCPNDHPPFLDICAAYRAAAASIGCELVTVFLSPANAEPLAAATYLDCPSLRDTRSVAAALEAALGATQAPAQFALAICHRYRAYRVLRTSRFSVAPTLVIAHEFGFFARWQRRLARALFAREVRFAGISDPVVEELRKTLAAPLLMPNGIDLGRAGRERFERAGALTALKLDPAHFNIGVVGRLHPKKQPQLALTGVASLSAVLPDVHLVFIGDGELKGQLQAAAGDLPVSFTGFVPEAARYLNALDALLIPSGEREAFSMVALEAMAAGVPVVAGPTPGPRFVLGDVGYYFDAFTANALAAAVQDVHEQRGRCAERLARGVQRAEQAFSVAALARRLESLVGDSTGRAQ